MADTRGVFTLREIIPIKLEEQWVPLSDVWIAPSPFIAGANNTGYFGGGNPNTARMDKVTYASDTTAAVPGANLSSNRGSLAASSARANALPQPIGTGPVPNIV